MKNKLLGLILAVLFMAMGSTDVMAQSKYIGKDQAITKLNQEIQSIQDVSTFELKTKKDVMTKMSKMLEAGQSAEESFTYIFGQLNRQFANKKSQLDAIRQEVDALLAK